MRRFKNISLFLLLLISVVLTVSVIENRLSLFGKAQIPQDLSTLESRYAPGGLEKLKKLREELEQQHEQEKPVSYQKQENGYTIAYNTKWWTTQEHNQETTFTLDTNLGRAVVTITQIEKSTLLNSLFLQTWADEFVQTYQLTDQLKNQEFTTIDEKPAYRFLLTETYFGQESPFETWLTVAYGKPYQITVRYESVLNSQAYALDLLNNLIFIDPQNPQQVKGVFDASVPTAYTAAEIAELTRPSVVNIIRLTCVVISSQGQEQSYLKPEYQFCASGKGTGTIVSSDGYIATAGHVVAPYPEQTLVEQVLVSEHPFVTDLIKETTGGSSELVATVQSNPTAFNSLIKATLTLIEQGKLQIRNDVSKLYVQTGNHVAQVNPDLLNRTDIESAISKDPSIIEAQLIGADFDNRYTPDKVLRGQPPTGSDVGIIKLATPQSWQMPALALGSTTMLKPGASLLIIGFPSVVEWDSPTHSVTQGILSAFKKDASGNTLIQTDASIERGNSGGPAFNQKGELIGIVTFGVEASLGNYNFLRDVGDLKSLLVSKNITLGSSDTYQDWHEGLTYFWNGYYTKANKSFAHVKQQYPQHPTVVEYMAHAEAEIRKGKDRGLLFGFEKDLLVRIAVYTVLFSVSGFIGIKLFLIIKKNFVTVVPNQEVSYV